MIFSEQKVKTTSSSCQRGSSSTYQDGKGQAKGYRERNTITSQDYSQDVKDGAENQETGHNRHSP
jgi:hypothetical protein